MRRFYTLSLIFVFGFAFCLTNRFAEGEFADDNFIPVENFEFPTPDGAVYIQDTPEIQRVPERIIGTNDFEKMRDLPPESQDYILGTKVGMIFTPSRFDPTRGWACTGFLVGPDLFMTNHHCIHDGSGPRPLDGIRIFMDYYQDSDVDRTLGGVTAGVSEILRADGPKDYALLRLDKPIGNTYGWLKLDTMTAVDSSQSVKLISHPQARSKEIVRRNTDIVEIPAGHPLANVPFELAYLADSERGSSGSPVFLRDGTGVIAIHHSAWSNWATDEPLYNAGSLMSYIAPEIQQWLPGGTPVDPPDPPTPADPPDPPDPPVRPDLVVVAPQVSKGTLRTGESFTLSATVRNQGNAAAQATTLRFYRSTDTTITTADVEVGTAAVSSLAPSDASEDSLTLTAPVSSGTYYYGACVDAVNNENVTDNNCSTAATLTVSTPPDPPTPADPPARPDLVVAAPQISKGTLRTGESFTLSATVRNQGNAASQATTLRFYRSTDTTLTRADIPIGTADVGALAPSRSSESSLTLTAPTDVGTYYYGACVDAVDNENVTDNNCSTAATLTVSTASDLVVVAPQVSKGTLRTGESFTLSVTVRNQGNAASQATTLRFYRSTDTTITRADVEVGTADVSSLVPSDTSEDSLTLTAPASSGTYYYGACVDTVNNENVTDNNCSAAVTIAVLVGFNPRTIVDQIFKVGSPVALTLPSASGGIPPYTYTLAPLPGGLSFNATERELSGTPTTPGTTTATYTATDARGASAALTFRITVIDPAMDVNGDGKVDVADLVIVAVFYGERVPAGTDLPADVNSDGVVDLLDLTLVAEAIDAADGGAAQISLDDIAAALEGAAAAPNALSGGNLGYRSIANALADARLEKEVPETVLKVLQQLLAEMEMAEVPESTALLPNYPNPFNPETWMPYHLAKATAVKITIYTVDGEVVRKLTLGHQDAGIYESRGRAAYWDGRNSVGEKVASGLYFYTLTADEFTTTRKMLIRK